MNDWQINPQLLTLNANEIHIWRTNLDLPLAKIQKLKQYLCEEEIERSDRFKFDIHRNRYIASRSILRLILEKYLNINPHLIEFQYGDKGKPRIIQSQNKDNIEFNISHSNELSLYGITKKYSIGIDVEYWRKISDIEAIAKRFFVSKEFNLIKTASENEKLELFCKLWTAKEAYLKCTGEGIAGGLDKFEVIFNNQKQAIKLSGINNNLAEISQWHLTSFKANKNYQGAVIVNSKDKFALKYYEY